MSTELLTADANVAAALAILDVFPASDAAPWFTIDGEERPRQIARSGSGGAFVLLPARGVLYVSSDGRCGIVSASVQAFIALVVACPYWSDVLKFSAGGNLDEMRRAAQILEDELDEPDEIDEARQKIRQSLALPEADDTIGHLHQAVSASKVVVRAPDGTPLTTLFGRFSLSREGD